MSRDHAGDEGASGPRHHLTASRRQGGQVTPLELFFDLVFVLAITQCTSLMGSSSAEGVAQGLVALGILWWAWVGYAWLTSVVDPQEGAVRLAILGAMAALVVCGLSIPGVFEDTGLVFAVAYGGVRAAHILLFTLASEDDADLRRSVIGLAVSTAVGVGILAGATLLHGWPQIGLWALALFLDALGPFLFGADGWRLEPSHFAERHGLFVIIALGESIVAIGLSTEHGLTPGLVTGAVVGVAVTGALWWVYFDVTAEVAAQRLESLPPGREQNELARDSYSLLHFPLVAGIVLVAVGAEAMLAGIGDPLELTPAVALVGGVGLYLLSLVAFRYRVDRHIDRARLAALVVLGAFIPAAVRVPALVAGSVLLAVLMALVAFEARDRLRADVRSG